jgi:peptidyl-prolyl cis-trans isomerase C
MNAHATEVSEQAEETVVDETEAVGAAQASRLVRLRGRLRPPSTRRGWLVLASVVVVLLGGGAGGYFWLQAGKLPAGVALRVGGQDVTVSALRSEANQLHALYGVNQPTDKSTVDGFWRSMAQADALRIVLDNVATARGVVISDKSAQDVVTRFVAQQYGSGPDAQTKFFAALGNAGTSEHDVLGELKHMLAINQLYNQVTAGTTVSEQDVTTAFGQRRGQLGTPERRDIRNIVVSTQDEANSVVAQLNQGAAFTSLAQQASLDDSTRSNGGDIGQVAAAQLDPGYAKTAFAAPQGGIFGPVHTQYGWNVGEIVSITAPVPATFSAVHDQLKQELIAEAAMRKWTAWLSQQIKAANVRYADQYRPADPDAVPTSPPGGATGVAPAPSK